MIVKPKLYIIASIAAMLLVLACSQMPPPEAYKTIMEPVATEYEMPDFQGKYVAQQQFALGLQAEISGDLLIAEQHLDIALITLISTQHDLKATIDSTIFNEELNQIVLALQRVHEKIEDEAVEDEIGVVEVSTDLEELFESMDTHELAPLDAFFDTLNLSQFSLPVELNDRVMREVNFLSKSVRSFTEGSLSRKTEFEEMILEKLDAKGMPADLINLALVESGFKTKAYSRAKASGLWQFIVATGRRYGLKSDFWVDMRRNPELATDAALNYLQDLHNEFDDWLLAMAAYNCGEGRVRRLLKAADGEVTFWDLKLPKETMHYVPRILAATIISKYPEHFDLHPEAVEPLRFDTVTVTECVPLQNVAEAAGSTLKEITALNWELIRWCTPPNTKSYTLRIPENSRETFVTAYAKMDKTKFARWHYHRVRSGENLGLIARSYGLSVEALRQANGIRGSLIRAGQNLLIPMPSHGAAKKAVAKNAPSQTQKASSAPSHNKSGKHTVKVGDNLGKIARSYGVSIADLKKWNNLSSDNLSVSQVLLVKPNPPPTASKDVLTQTTASYKVQSGDSYYSIALKYGLSTEDLMALNNTKSSALSLGQLIKVPASQTSQSSPNADKQKSKLSQMTKYYVVKNGDNLYKIAKRNNTTVDALSKLNNISAQTPLQIGQKLVVGTQKIMPGGVYTVRKGDSLWDIARIYGISIQDLMDWNSLASATVYPGMRLKVGM